MAPMGLASKAGLRGLNPWSSCSLPQRATVLLLLGPPTLVDTDVFLLKLRSLRRLCPEVHGRGSADTRVDAFYWRRHLALRP